MVDEIVHWVYRCPGLYGFRCSLECCGGNGGESERDEGPKYKKIARHLEPSLQPFNQENDTYSLIDEYL
jgi:hypothetical protein